MITITRLLARQVRAVFSRCLSFSSRGPFPPVMFRADGDGLTIRTTSHDAAIAFHQPGDVSEERFAVPFNVLKQCEGGKADDVTLERIDQRVAVQWNDGGIPQVVQVEAESTEEDFPAVPSEMAANDARLVAALRDAAATTNNIATRYALSCLQLQGEQGMIAATDGHQLLIQDGFDFPWDDDVLIPARRVFASRELPMGQPVEVGKSDDWVCVRIGPWTLHFKIEREARFPHVEDHVPDADSAVTTLQLSDADALFLTKSVKRLPCGDDCNLPVTVDLNGEIAIRAQGDEQSSPTELILTNSSRSGEVIQFNTNREFLARAMQLGFRDVRFTGPEAPAFCHDQNRQYLWALLGKDGAIQSHERATRIESPTDPAVSPTSQPESRRPPTTMPKHKQTSGNAKHNDGESATETNGSTSLIEQAESLRDSLQGSLSQTRELIAALKRQKKQSRLMKSTLASLRQLQTVDV